MSTSWPAGPTSASWMSYPPVGPDDDAARDYAGFWRRWAGSLIDNLVVWAIVIPVQVVVLLVSAGLAGMAETCDRRVINGAVYEVCQPSGLIPVLASLLLFAFNVFVWWRIVAGRIGRCGASFGMETMSIELVRASSTHPVTAGTAIARQLSSWIITVALFVPYGVVLLANVDELEEINGSMDRLGDVLFGSWLDASLLVFLILLPSLSGMWMLIDRRYQTLYDKMCGTVVVNS